MSNRKFTIHANNSLIISDTRYEDRGTYTCVATNDLAEMRSDKADAQLTVNGWFSCVHYVQIGYIQLLLLL